MAKKKKKKSHFWSAAKWVAAIGGGAVVGAYTLRFVDKKLAARGISTLRPSDEAPAIGGAIGGGEAYAMESPVPNPHSPLQNPLAVQAISPVVPIPVAMPPLFPLSSSPAPYPSAPPPGHVYDQGPLPAMPLEPVVESGPKVETAAEARARKEAEMEELVRRFELGEVG